MSDQIDQQTNQMQNSFEQRNLASTEALRASFQDIVNALPSIEDAARLGDLNKKVESLPDIVVMAGFRDVLRRTFGDELIEDLESNLKSLGQVLQDKTGEG